MAFPRDTTLCQTFSNRFGCDSIFCKKIIVAPAKTAQRDTAVCFGQRILVKNKIYAVSGSYKDTFQTVQFCDSILTTNLTIIDTSVFLQEFVFCDGDTIRIGDKFYTRTGQFKEVFSSIAGCDSTVLTKIKSGGRIYCDSLNCRMFVPNIFSPNFDGINDEFEVFTSVTKIYEMQIFDRWGNQIFIAQSDGILAPRWNGNALNGSRLDAGVYIYVLKGVCANGKPFVTSGDVTLVR